MQFLTILKPKLKEYHVHFQHGARGLYFNNFEYELHDDPTTESVAVHFGPDMKGCPPRAFWPDVETGARRGAEEARERGLRLCCVRFTLLFAKYHDVDTTSRAVQIRVADCVGADVALRHAEPLPPLRPEWLTSDVVALARGIHSNAALDGLPALTDALLEAGCDDPLALEHLQTCPDHGPMCWVVEMICVQAAARG
ncbi:MAG: hypothetical protein J0I06_01125 [Planctomycetes bacterium]|nr:hypothetical protein [Planctomycetota bacterium]